MTTSPTATSGEQTLHCALELSKNSWLLAAQFPGRDNPSLYPIRGGDTSGLMTKLDAARDRLTKISGNRGKTPGGQAGAVCRWRMISARFGIGLAPGTSKRAPR